MVYMCLEVCVALRVVAAIPPSLRPTSGSQVANQQRTGIQAQMLAQMQLLPCMIHARAFA